MMLQFLDYAGVALLYESIVNQIEHKLDEEELKEYLSLEETPSDDDFLYFYGGSAFDLMI